MFLDILVQVQFVKNWFYRVFFFFLTFKNSAYGSQDSATVWEEEDSHILRGNRD